MEIYEVKFLKMFMRLNLNFIVIAPIGYKISHELLLETLILVISFKLHDLFFVLLIKIIFNVAKSNF
jgi:hypothetical protein